MDTKAFSRVEIKDADKGEVVCVFSTLNVVDSDSDVSLPGSFESGAKVRISAYQHTSWNGVLPVGKGSIRETKTEALMEGRFFLDLPEAAATFAVVKELEDMQEWSYGFDALEYSFGEHDGQQVRFLTKQKVHEISPVMIGAGVNTRTLSAKSGLKLGDHVDSVLAEIEAIVARASEVVALRAEKGKGIAGESAARLARLQSSAKQLEQLLSAPATPDNREAVAREAARFLAHS